MNTSTSLKATEWAWQQPLTGTKKLLLLAVAREVDKHGKCRATQEQLAEYCGCSVRQVRRMMKELSLELYLRGGPLGALNGGRAANIYVLPREAREEAIKPHTDVRINRDSSKPDIGDRSFPVRE